MRGNLRLLYVPDRLGRLSHLAHLACLACLPHLARHAHLAGLAAAHGAHGAAAEHDVVARRRRYRHVGTYGEQRAARYFERAADFALGTLADIERAIAVAGAVHLGGAARYGKVSVGIYAVAARDYLPRPSGNGYSVLPTVGRKVLVRGVHAVIGRGDVSRA